MQALAERHAKTIKGSLACFDRIALFGAFQSIGHAQAMSKRGLQWDQAGGLRQDLRQRAARARHHPITTNRMKTSKA